MVSSLTQPPLPVVLACSGCHELKEPAMATDCAPGLANSRRTFGWTGAGAGAGLTGSMGFTACTGFASSTGLATTGFATGVLAMNAGGAISEGALVFVFLLFLVMTFPGFARRKNRGAYL